MEKLEINNKIKKRILVFIKEFVKNNEKDI